MNTKSLSQHINSLASFCGLRDIDELTQNNLFNTFGIYQADIMVLFGGSIICGGDVLADAIKNHVAKKYIIVGGEGHTTQALRDIVHSKYPQIDTLNQPEAIVFSRYIQEKYGLNADYLECESTNCGNNITYLLDIIKKNSIPAHSIILSQDATMQRRMSAGFSKYMPESLIINFATYSSTVIEKDDILQFQSHIDGMWPLERYISLLMGEIPRLRDDEYGYGPNGKAYISHVDIPEDIINSFNILSETYGDLVRKANPLYASKDNIIFLDIDGVLNSQFWNDLHQKEISDGTLIDEDKILLLSNFAQKYNAKIVLHSGWKYWFNEDIEPIRKESVRLVNLLKAYDLHISDITPDLASDEIKRNKKFSLVKASEILQWVSQHTDCNWVVFDDLDLHNDEVSSHQVKTDSSVGLQPSDIEEAVLFFK